MTICFNSISVEEADFDANLLANLFEYIVERNLNVHMLTIIKNDSRVIEACAHPFRKVIPRETYSMSKSFISLAIGIAEKQGLITLSDKVVTYFPDKVDNSIKDLEFLTIEHLLTMSVGFDFQKNNNRIWFSSDWIKNFFHTPLENKPGTKFDYNNYTSYILSAVIQKVTGLRVCDYLYKNFFNELGIGKPVWTTHNGVDSGYSGLFLSPEDEEIIAYYLLKPEKLYEKGILNESYLKRATSKQIETKWYPDLCQFNPNSGYGYQFWVSERYNGFNACGALTQRITVIPEIDLSIILHCGDNRLNYLKDEYIIPAGKKGYNGGKKRLNKAIVNFEKPIHKKFSIPTKRKNTTEFYDLEKNIDRTGSYAKYRIDSIGYKQAEDELVLIIKERENIYQFECGLDGKYIENRQKINYGGELMEAYPCFKAKWINGDHLYIEMQKLISGWRSILEIKFNQNKIEVLAYHSENGHGHFPETTYYGNINKNFDIS